MKRENKGLRVKRKGTGAKEKVKRLKEEVKLQIVLRVKKRMNEFFLGGKNMQGDNKGLREEIKGKKG